MVSQVVCIKTENLKLDCTLLYINLHLSEKVIQLREVTANVAFK